MIRHRSYLIGPNLVEVGKSLILTDRLLREIWTSGVFGCSGSEKTTTTILLLKIVSDVMSTKITSIVRRKITRVTEFTIKNWHLRRNTFLNGTRVIEVFLQGSNTSVFRSRGSILEFIISIQHMFAIHWYIVASSIAENLDKLIFLVDSAA